ncbi:kinase domain protein (macronuclear) [Tetrahymena thermophila SB210]|uniref:Kinase domain protein n=1 Tax=Tetrahymena thermophila (strain SB210) TaxID=312017 RepID=Q23QT1_TETTS|nr:kinase domain protein [Tetrahymena thermophila SB210]EAR98807.2 kinase domain protein [Tetrahymena thermophila SB210]|eukprot:XP_001019052.2 kinase domain protein [Tetrahymena thermophila SB210]
MFLSKQLCYKSIVAGSKFGEQIRKNIKFNDDEQSMLQERIMNRYQHSPSNLKSLREYCCTLPLDKNQSKTLSAYVDGIISKQKGIKIKVMNAINKVIAVTKILAISSILKIKKISKFYQRKKFYFLQKIVLKNYKPNTRKRALKLQKVQQFVVDQINQCIGYLKEGYLSNQCINEILLPFTKKINFSQQINQFKLSITNFFFSNSAFYLNVESYLYELLNNTLILLNQSLKNLGEDKHFLTYFQLIVVVLKNICQNDLYILTYDMCKSFDKLILELPESVKDYSFYDKLMLSYHYYKGFSQTNFDENHKFYDYIKCKHFFFKLLYKKYPKISEEINETEKNLSNLMPQPMKMFCCVQNTVERPSGIKKQVKDTKKKEQMKETEQSFFENFFLLYLFFRQEQGNSHIEILENLLKQCLLIYKMNPKFDLGVQQIYKCFHFYDKGQECFKTCLYTVREQMKNEKLTDKFKKETIYEKYIDLTDEKKLQIPLKNSSNLQKYLKQLAEIYIYNQQPIEFLNIWRCLSILSPESCYINYMLYLEQLQEFIFQKFYTDNSKEQECYQNLVEELQEDLKSQNQEKQMFWHLSYQQFIMRFQEKGFEKLPLNIRKDIPIISIRKIMNNIFLEIQQSIDQKKDIFNKVFGHDYFNFKQQQENIRQQQNRENQMAFTTKMKIQNKQVYLKVYSFDFKTNKEFNYNDYRFVQEVAICIYFRKKQHQKYLPFQKNIGYHSFNRYIYHFIQDNQIFLILEYYPILYKQILSNEHFRCQDKHDYIQENEQMTRSKASSISSIKSYQIDENFNVFDQKRRVSEQFGIQDINFTSSDDQRQRNNSTGSELSSISYNESKNENWLSNSFSSSIQFSKDRISYVPKFQNQIKLQSKEFTKKDLFICMLRIEQIFEVLKDNNMLHKDIKLLNIVWRETDEPILIDFGIVELYQTFSYFLSSNGTIPYRSYQQSKNLPINENTDLTQFIICIYELARGEKIDNDEKASYISKNIHKELKDMFSRDFNNLIQTVVDCQLDTIKSRAKYFMWQKFEIFMNLLYDCQKQNIQGENVLHYQDFYVKVKKTIKRAVQKKKFNLDVEFDLNLLLNLKNDPTFQMLISLQSHDILKHYESLLYIIINKQKMEECNKLIETKIQLNSSSIMNDTHVSAFFLNKEQQNRSIYSLENEHLKVGILKIYNQCFINENQVNDQHFSETIVRIFNKNFKILELQKTKYKFNFENLVNLFSEYSKENEKATSKCLKSQPSILKKLRDLSLNFKQKLLKKLLKLTSAQMKLDILLKIQSIINLIVRYCRIISYQVKSKVNNNNLRFHNNLYTKLMSQMFQLLLQIKMKMAQISQVFPFCLHNNNRIPQQAKMNQPINLQLVLVN